MTAFQFLIETIFSLYLMLVMLRMWLQLVRADFYNPFSQLVVKATQPIVGPMRRFIPAIGRFDTAVFVFILIVLTLKIITIQALFYSGFPALPLLAKFIFKSFLIETLQLVFLTLILRAILSWVSQGNNPVEMVLQQLTEPLVAPIRRVLPPMGGFDFSILVTLIAVQFIKLLIQDML